MMKKAACIGIVAFTLSISQIVSADEHGGSTVWDGFSGFFDSNWNEDFSATLGVKVWLNDWRRDAFFPNNPFVTTGGQSIAVFTSDSKPNAETSDGIEAAPIPQLALRYKWLILTGSYYPKTDFDFDTTRRSSAIDVDGTRRLDITVSDTTSAERDEWDVAGGVRLHKYVVVLAGYKKISQEITFSSSSTVEINGNEVPGANTSASSDIEVEGPTIGVAASVPIGQGLGLYASYAHGFMDAKIQDSSGVTSDSATLDASYDVAEAGFSYSHGMDYLPAYMPLSAATVYAGYRWQNFETDARGSSADRADTTKGFALGVNLSF